MKLQEKVYKYDIVFVIDSTHSMRHFVEQIKSNALTLGDKICDAMKSAGKYVGELRMRVIDFADFATEGDKAIRLSDFYAMPAQKAEFEKRVQDIDVDRKCKGFAKNGLEALFTAMSSDWVKIGADEYGRHVIVLMTDAVPLNLQERAGCIGYNTDKYPENINELEEIWNSDGQSLTALHSKKKRLVLYAPKGSDSDGHTWDNVSGWVWVCFNPIDRNQENFDLDIGAIIADVVRSA